MNNAQHAGGPGRLEITVKRKQLRAASGESFEVLADIDIVLERGKVAAIVGPSGCGKTTLLKIVAGLDPAFDGRVSLPAPGRLGMVFQEPRLLAWRSVEDNVRLAAPDATPDAISETLEILGLGAHRNHFPGELSLGLARRVALARALAVQPDVLLLDEPFVSLDAALARQLRGELAMLVDRRPVTVLLVTHDIEEAVELADVLFVLSARPSKVLAEVAIDQPRGSRSPGDIARLLTQVRNKTGPLPAGSIPSRRIPN